MDDIESAIRLEMARVRDRATTNPPSGYDAGVIDGLAIALSIINGHATIRTQG